MKKLVIILEISDEETVKNYQDVHQNLILEDLRHGNLIDVCEIKDVILGMSDE
jgi:hypothetical protein